MDGSSLDIKQLQIERLKEVFPELVSEDKIDWERLRATLGEDITIQNERYVLNWAGKSDAFRTLQTGTTATLAPAKEESINFDTTDNIFIEGENLEVLKVLQKAYFGAIKCIIIDPPYNTGNDSFIYPDRFSESKEEYMKRVGDKDEEGYLMKEGLFRKNSKENGQYHSNWLSMMYPRLFLARNLLKDVGVIFVHIDDNEVHNLRLLMNEIFGEENFVAQFVWKSRQNKDNRNITGASIDHEYLLCYGSKIRGSQRKLEQYTNPDNDPRGAWTSGNMVGILPKHLRPNCHYDLVDPVTGINYGKPKMGWRYDKNTMTRLISEEKILWPSSPEGRPRRKLFLNELKEQYTGYSSLIGENIYTTHGTKEIEKLFGFRVIEFPKPSMLIEEIIIQGLVNNDIILDFFAGSGTTAHALLELNKEDNGNRKFILIQLPEKTDENSEAFKAGYKTIADICKERIRRVIKKIEVERKPKEQQQIIAEEQKELDLGFKVFKLKPSNFKQWRTDIQNVEELEQQLDAFTDPVKPEAEEENMLFELLLKSGYDLNSKIESKQSGNSRYFLINTDELVLQLSGSPKEVITDILSINPKKVIMLDRLFENNDQLKTNTYLQFKDAGVDFRTV
ncbi:MAG: DNA methylase [Ignavibacteria bacterium RIFOXYC2_FULL_35_21]|nr:MAG: DNA methylase [Ignavibacteria bacterium RIFOXYA2_FULL_35_10]OGV21258.1 MAG: DNA methylase [Ignavibacteria bacterium RIFOXYC2_FULL_35_21]